MKLLFSILLLITMASKGQPKSTCKSPSPAQDVPKNNNRFSVISSQNDNGEESDEFIENSDKSLQCDFCENCFCFKCTRVSNKSYEALCKSQNEGLSWFCVHCRISFSGVTKMTNKINQLEQTQKEILVTVKELKEKDSDSDKQISRQEIEDLVREEVEEQKRIDERKLNIMCFGSSKNLILFPFLLYARLKNGLTCIML